MDANSPETQDYLLELYQMTTGDINAQVSMYDVGAAIGMEKNDAGKLAEDLIGDGLVAVKTLSGGIGITDLGIEKAQSAAGAGPTTAATIDLGKGPVMEEKAMEVMAPLIKEIQTRISRNEAAYGQIEEMVMDLKTMEVQLLSPRPKTAIVREILRSLHATLNATGESDITAKIGKMLSA
jgi:hypothetical protein